jgi:hypothetical protein
MRRPAALTALIGALATLLLAGPAVSATLTNPLREVANLGVSAERTTHPPSLAYLAGMSEATAAYQAARQKIDSGRQPNPNPCTLILLCPVDPQLQDWTSLGGIVEPVLFTARSGATLSGHVWATSAGPAKRPLIEFINGSVIGYEQGYWFLAQTLARAGFVVLTFDAQGEGMSDQFGQAPDQLEGSTAGTPVLSYPQTKSLGGTGTPFYDGGEDALDFALSTPIDPYVPVPSRSSGTSHAAKQQQRVDAGLDNAYDPLWNMIDRTRIGISGHSYGAVAASWIGQADHRVGAVVALDNLCLPTQPSPDEATAVFQTSAQAGGPFAVPPICFGYPGSDPAPTPRVPSLGITADYLLTSEPYLVEPPAAVKNSASLAFSRAGIDTGEIVIRGGTHLDFVDVPFVPATIRGIDLITWYTTAWFAKYLEHAPGADAMLTTTRWRTDARSAAYAPDHSANALSWHYPSRLDIVRSNGARFDCEHLRTGCAGQAPTASDCGPTAYSFLAVDLRTVAWTRC